MPSVDNRVVSMTFDNRTFENRLAETMKSLDSLNETIAKVGTNQSFDQVNAAAQRFDTSHMSSALDSISSKFSAMGAIGFSVINNLTTGIMGIATHILEIGKQDILAPIITGGKERAMNIEQAKFMFEGMGINVDKAMASAKSAVLGTAYGLDAAAKVAAQFGASGIAAGDQMTGALRGVAGAAAMTGSSFAEIGDIFAQSAALGHVNTMDLQQFSTRGLNAAAAIAPIMHKTEAEVREMASSGELDFKTFADAMDKAFGKHATEANKTFAGSLANVHAAMSRMGEAFFATQLNQQRDVFNALSPAIDKLTGALKPLFAAFNDISKVVSDKLIDRIKNFNFGPITTAIPFFISGMKDIFRSVELVSGVIRTAFRDIFPKDTVPTIVRISILFKEFASHLVPSAAGLERLRTVFKGLFSIVEIGWHIIEDVAQLLVHLYHDIFPANEGGVLKFAASFAELLVKLDNFLITEGRLDAFFAKLNVGIAAAVNWVRALEEKIIGFFNNVGGKVGDADPVSETLGRMSQRADQVSRIWDKLQNGFDKIKGVLDRVWTVISDWFKELIAKIADAFHPGDFDTALDALNTGLLGGLALLLRRFFEGKSKIDISFGGKMMGKVNALIGNLKTTLKTMQTEIKAKAILEIAAAVGIIAASLLVLSLIDSKKLTQALLGITVAFSELALVMKVLDDIGSGDNAASSTKIAVLAGAMIAMATSMLILSAALAVLAAIDPLRLSGALLAMGASLSMMVATLKALQSGEAGTTGMAKAAVALGLMAGAMVVLSGAIAVLSAIDPIKLAQGLLGMGASLAMLVATLTALKEGGAGMVIAAAAMGMMATALVVLSSAVAILAAIDPLKLAAGLLGIGAGLAMMVATLQAVKNGGPGMIAAAVSMGIMAGALLAISTAVALLGLLSLETLAKGLGAIGLMLLALVIATKAMENSIGGAIAMVIIAGALTMLAAVIEVLGRMKIDQILTGILAVVAVMFVLGVAAASMQQLILPMVGMAIGLGAIGLAFMLLGGGLALLGKGLQLIAEFGVAGAKAAATAIPVLIGTMVEGLIGQINNLIKVVPLVVRLIEAVLDQLLETIIKLAPKIANALIALFKAALKALTTIYPEILAAGLFLLLTLLEGIANNIDPIVTAVVDIIANFINAIANNLDKIIQAGVNLLISFLAGISSAQQQIATAVIQIMINFVQTIVNNIQIIIDAGANMLIQLIFGITRDILKIADAITQIIQEFIVQIGAHAVEIASTGTNVLIWFLGALTGDVLRIATAITDMITALVTALGDDAGKIAGAGADALTRFLTGLGGDAIKIGQAMSTLIHDIVTAIVGVLDNAPAELNRLADGFIRFLNALADVIRSKSGPLGDALGNIAEAMVGGFAGALKHAILKFAEDAISGLPGFVKDGIIGTIKDVLGIKSPSKVMMEIGDLTAQGLIIGLSRGLATASIIAGDGATSITNSMSEALAKTSDILSNTTDFNPTITPVLDLTQVQLEATKIDGLMKVSALNPAASFSVAGDISAAQQAALDASRVQADQNVAPTKDVNFNQTINAPEPLTANQIYRNTKSQIALAKEELGL